MTIKMEKPTNGKLTNILQGVIITMLAGFGVVFWSSRNELRDDIGTVQKSVNVIEINQAVIHSKQKDVLDDLKKNDSDHKEFFKLLKDGS